ncbi:MAG: hypothetical protein Q9209_004580 [Squamulea sp. 1 TL-2023]
MALTSYPKSFADEEREHIDIANAIRASLRPHRTDLSQAQEKWIPQTESEWKTYRHQQELMEQAGADTTNGKKATHKFNRYIGDLRKTDLIPTDDKQVPQSESDWRTYGRQQQPTQRKRTLEDISKENKPAIGKPHRAPGNPLLEPSKGDPRAQKTEEGWSFHSEEIQKQQADPSAPKFHSGKLFDEDSTTTTMLSAAGPHAGWRRKREDKNNDRNTQQMQAGQKAPSSSDGNKNDECCDSQDPSKDDTPPTALTPPRQTIEDRIKEMQATSVDELPWTDDRDGDTYIFIDPPAKQPEQTDHMYDNYVERYRRPFVIRSDRLQALHSPFFERILGPTYQFRTIRRRCLHGQLPSHIKYVIDLTPPSEGEDAAWLMTELCCVEGVRNWNQGWTRWDISKTLVGGEDEFTGCLAAGEADERPTPELSPIRHRSSIERVLNAIRDKDPKLDSAVKVYTTFTVARFFEITQSPLTDYIVRWLRAPPNSLFIEALPEVALKIGDGFQCHDVIRDSFAILVGEEALANRMDKSNTSHTVFGRKKNDVPESYRTRIEYASKSFMDRIFQIFSNLVDPDMTWIETLPEFRKLSNDENTSRKNLVKETKAAFKAFVRGAIYSVLWSDLEDAPKFELGGEKGDSLYPWTSQTDFWNPLTMPGRLMTTTFWSALRSFCVFGQYDAGSLQRSGFGSASDLTTNLTSWPQHRSAWNPRLSENKKDLLVHKFGVVEIRYSYLQDLIPRCRIGCTLSPWNSTGLIKPLKHQPIISFPKTESSDTKKILTLPYFDSQIMWVDAGPSEDSTDNVKLSFDVSGIDIDADELRREIRGYISSVCYQLLEPPDSFIRNEPMKQVMTPTLVCLDEPEWKYLPLYAGGLDDGSGGVFNDDVPMAETGFSTAGPGVHRGTGSSTASSDYDFVGGQELQSTHHTSTMTNDSFSDQLDHRKVYSDDGGLWDHIRNNKDFATSTTESFIDSATLAAPSTVDDESEEDFVLPLRLRDAGAEHRDIATGRPTTQTQGSGEGAKAGEEKEEDEDYSDIFMNSDQDMDDDDDNDEDDTVTEKGENDSDAEADEERALEQELMQERVMNDEEDMVLV